MRRITNADLAGMYKRYCVAVAKHGYDTSEFHLRLGDEAHNYASLVRGDGTPGTGSYGNLGETRREAYRSLVCMAQLLEDIAYKNQRENN